jgi:hypothetical protein
MKLSHFRGSLQKWLLSAAALRQAPDLYEKSSVRTCSDGLIDIVWPPR